MKNRFLKPGKPMIINFEAFKQFLVDSGKSERTILGYLANITIFSRRFEQTNGEILCPDNLWSTLG